jgi:hypothetical protein
MEGVPIAKEELPVGSLLRPVLERLSPPEFQLAIHDLLMWWGNRAEESSPRRPFRVRHIEATSCLLETCPPLAGLFELSRDNLEFRTEVPASVRQETPSTFTDTTNRTPAAEARALL